MLSYHYWPHWLDWKEILAPTCFLLLLCSFHKSRFELLSHGNASITESTFKSALWAPACGPLISHPTEYLTDKKPSDCGGSATLCPRTFQQRLICPWKHNLYSWSNQGCHNVLGEQMEIDWNWWALEEKTKSLPLCWMRAWEIHGVDIGLWGWDLRRYPTNAEHNWKKA